MTSSTSALTTGTFCSLTGSNMDRLARHEPMRPSSHPVHSALAAVATAVPTPEAMGASPHLSDREVVALTVAGAAPAASPPPSPRGIRLPSSVADGSAAAPARSRSMSEPRLGTIAGRAATTAGAAPAFPGRLADFVEAQQSRQVFSPVPVPTCAGSLLSPEAARLAQETGAFFGTEGGRRYGLAEGEQDSFETISRQRIAELARMATRAAAVPALAAAPAAPAMTATDARRERMEELALMAQMMRGSAAPATTAAETRRERMEEFREMAEMFRAAQPPAPPPPPPRSFLREIAPGATMALLSAGASLGSRYASNRLPNVNPQELLAAATRAGADAGRSAFEAARPALLESAADVSARVVDAHRPSTMAHAADQGVAWGTITTVALWAGKFFLTGSF